MNANRSRVDTSRVQNFLETRRDVRSWDCLMNAARQRAPIQSSEIGLGLRAEVSTYNASGATHRHTAQPVVTIKATISYEGFWQAHSAQVKRSTVLSGSASFNRNH